MHEIQEKLLKLMEEKNLGKSTLREIGSFIGETSPQKIKHHLAQLEKRGLIHVDKKTGMIEKFGQNPGGKRAAGSVKGFLKDARLLMIPILGSANAGPAQIFADQNIEGYLRVSSSLVERSVANAAAMASRHRLFALKVSGPSMNRAEVQGKTIEDGDYIVVDSQPEHPRDGEIILSVIDGMANVKKYYVDKENNQILLMSDSTHDFPAIHIHEDDDFTINGKVVGVIKKPKKKGAK
jgi:repressor LexA